jgi:hypothetical protein
MNKADLLEMLKQYPDDTVLYAFDSGAPITDLVFIDERTTAHSHYFPMLYFRADEP